MNLNALRERSRFRKYEADYVAARGGLCFIQGDQSIANQAGAAFRSDVNNELQALVTNSQGATVPGTTYRNMIWHDTTLNLIRRRNAANTGWINVGTLDESFVLSRSSNTILGQSDVGKSIVCTAAFTQTLTAAATLADGWWVAYNAAGFLIVLDPNSSELIDGATTKTVSGSGLIYCSGTAFFTVGFGSSTTGVFRKADPTTAAFVKTGAATISTQAATLTIEVAGNLYAIPASTAVTMPSHSSGTDYAIWAKTDGTLEATSNHVTPPSTNARKVGGYHYAPGGNATGVAGGDTTPAVNAYSIWDLKFRPACQDARGMTLVADGFWADIYLLGVGHPTNGSSKYNVTIADGSNPAKVPAKFGGNGTTAYADGNWWNMGEALESFGKRFPTVDEFGALAYGTTEAASATAATDPVSTILRAESTSKWGVMLSTGNMYVWGADFGGGAAGAAWTANTNGRGSTYQLSNAVLLGGAWGNGADSGSRCSSWNVAPTNSGVNVGARGVCDHLQLD